MNDPIGAIIPEIIYLRDDGTNAASKESNKNALVFN